MVLHFGYSAKIVNVKTAFMYGDLKEEIYTECPQRMADVEKDDCIILNKFIYGFVQQLVNTIKKLWRFLKALVLLEAVMIRTSTSKRLQRV